MVRTLLRVLPGLFLAASVGAAPPEVPQVLTYQGVLLDDQGQPRSGSVALTLRIYDAIAGGSLVYKQEYPAVTLVDGVFTVLLGPTGSASDAPTNPLTTDLFGALAGDAGATGPNRFLEVTVGSDGPLVRSPILTVPYALRAAEADTAADAGGIAGFSSSVFQQIVENSNLDGTGPLNGDPTEGFGDTDADGLANFVDPDNDDDGLDDGTELAQGSDLNLVTPVLSGVAPPAGFALLTQPVTLSGQNFDPATTVTFGSETPTASNVTPTSLDVLVGPQPAGLVDVRVTLPNGEQHLVADAFEFLSSVFHSVAFPASSRLGLSVRNQATLLVSGNDEYQFPLQALPNTFPFVSKHTSGQGDVAFSPSGALAGIRCRTVSSDECHVEIARDDDGDQELEDETGILVVVLDFDTATRIYEPTLDFDSSGNVAAGFAFANLFRALAVVHDRNGDSVITPATNEYLVVDTTVGTFARVDFALDPSDRAALVYFDGIDNAVSVAWDRSGDGDFADTVGGNPELASVATGVTSATCVGTGFAPDGDLVAIHSSNGVGTVFLRDHDQDGDFDGASEVLTIDSGLVGFCDLAADDGNPVAVFHDLGGRLNLLVDRDDDGDFGGVDETLDLGPATGLLDAALDHNANGVAMLATVFQSLPGFILFDPTL